MPIDFPNSPSTNDTHTEAGKTWVYNGTSWTLTTLSATIPDGGVATGQLANSAVTAAKLATGSVETAKLANSAVTAAKLDANAAIQPTIVDAKGDLIVGFAADTVVRVAVGTDGQALLANSSAGAGVSWGQAGYSPDSDQTLLGVAIFT